MKGKSIVHFEKTVARLMGQFTCIYITDYEAERTK